MSIEGQGHFFTIYFPGFVCFVLYKAKISGERLQDHWSSGFLIFAPKHRLWVLVKALLAEVVLTCTDNLCFEQKYENSQKINGKLSF